MAGVKEKSGPPGNANGFKHGLSMVEDKRREKRLPRGKDKRFKFELLNSLIEDAGGQAHITTARKLQAEIIATDATFQMDRAIQRVLRLNPKYRENPAALSKLDEYRRPVINSLSANLDRFGFTRVLPPQKTLDEILAEDESGTDQPEKPQP